MDAGEYVTATLKREFGEEALNSLDASEEEKREMEKIITKLFERGTEVAREGERGQSCLNGIAISGLRWLCG